ncbi:MAG: cytochrome c oxidase subunit II [Phycisphaerales bacterium]
MQTFVNLILAMQDYNRQPVPAPADDRGFWLPPSYSNFTHHVDGPFMFITWVCIAFFVAIVAVMLWFMWRYSRHRGIKSDFDAATHNTPLEITWSAIPLLLVIGMFYYGFRGYMDMIVEPNDGYTINVTAQKWSWTFNYPEGAVSPELHLPPNENIKLVLQASDVLHAFFVPDFRVKVDIVPGKYSYLWFKAENRSGEPEWHHLFCAEFCGTDHSNMIATVVVHPTREDYEAWLATAMAYQDWGMTLVEAGDFLYQRRGCMGCHTIDGLPLTGPSLKNTWREVSSGQRKVKGPAVDASDVENYIADSLKTPQAQIVLHADGGEYPSNMPKIKLSEFDVTALIAYIKWLENNDGHPYNEFEKRKQEERAANGG